MKEPKKPINKPCPDCKGDGVVYKHITVQDKSDPFSLPTGVYEEECEECNGLGYYTHYFYTP